MIIRYSLILTAGALLLWVACNDRSPLGSAMVDRVQDTDTMAAVDSFPPVADTLLYAQKMMQLVHGKPSSKWPVKTPFPPSGAILPYHRIVAYYGNFYSAGMGILGQLQDSSLILRLKQEMVAWERADTDMPVIPAIHYIAVTAQRLPGRDGKYRLRMPFSEVDKAADLAARIDGLLFLDVQVGHSSVQEELPLLLPYLSQPTVHLGIDPEYAMKNGAIPCSVIGTLDAADINFAITYLAQLVKQYQLPPKVLVIHRFTKGMLTNYRQIRLQPGVQVVINMDGFGFPAKKIDSYKSSVAGEPVQFTGFKLFYKQDLLYKRDAVLMTPEDILRLYPQPVYIQYQ